MGSEQKPRENPPRVYKVSVVISFFSPGGVEIFPVLTSMSLSFTVNRTCERFNSSLL